jgi:hypothetical protein
MSLIGELRRFKKLTLEAFGKPLGWSRQQVWEAETENSCSLMTFLRIGISHHIPDNVLMKLAREHYLNRYK